jgi:hypothetical protein
VGHSSNERAIWLCQLVLPDHVANADRNADTGNDDHVHSAPSTRFSQHLVSSSPPNYSKLQEIIESNQWLIVAYLCLIQVGNR